MIPTPGDILNAVCQHCGLTRFDLTGRRRFPRFVFARRVAVLVMHDLRLSFMEIGRIIDRDHSSIMHLFYSAGADAIAEAGYVRAAITEQRKAG